MKTDRAMKLPLSVSHRQQGNPMIPALESGAEVTFVDSSVADFMIGKDLAVLFLTLKYHRQHPDYLTERLRGFRGSFPVRILLFLVNDDNPDRIISRLTSVTFANNMNFIPAFTYEEAARWLLTLYNTQESGVDDLKAMNESQVETATDALHALGLSRREAEALLMGFPTVADVIMAPKEAIAKGSTLNEKKIDSLYAMFNGELCIRVGLTNDSPIGFR
jgi:DNA excision repair protein ERCC-1